MKHVKLVILFLLYCASTVVMACPSNGDVNSYLEFRAKFIEASLQGKAEGVVDFYRFPLFGGGMYESDKNLKISRKTFMQLYEVLFVKTLLNGAPTIFKDLSSSKKIGLSVLANIAQPDGCIKEQNLKNGIYDAHYKFELVGGNWKVTYVGFGDGYEDAIDELKARKIKPW
jgi:hypothetical protein